jgi:hypothetical protein
MAPTQQKRSVAYSQSLSDLRGASDLSYDAPIDGDLFAIGLGCLSVSCCPAFSICTESRSDMR